jgi:MinD-like ATPase involved in chromosome partitioning or flagellar assembly
MSPATAIVAVVGASGGLGASTLALAVGRRLAATGPACVVVDLDLLRGGLEVTAGVEHLPGRRWDDLRHVRGRVAPEGLLPVLPHEDGCHVLSARGGAPPDLPGAAVRDVLTSLAGGPARVVLDLPASSPALDHVLALDPLVVLVTALRTRALADADAVVSRLVESGPAHAGGPDVRVVTRGPRPPEEVVDDVVAHLGVGHLHHLADDARVPRDAERGLFPGVARDAVRRCADVVVGAVDGLAEAS